MSTREPIEFTTALATEAGELLLRYFGTPLTRTIKTNENDFATEADMASEALIIREIKKQFPNDCILAEESGECGTAAGEYTWVVDPLDGTCNFANNLEEYGVMISRALGEHMQFAVVYNPSKDILAIAEAGKGTMLNGHSVHVPDVNVVAELRPLLARIKQTSGADEVQRLKEYLEVYGCDTESLRSAAANTLAILEGKRDAYIINDMYPWDSSCPALLLKEAGATVTDFSGKPFTWKTSKQHFLAAPPGVHGQLLEIMTPA